MHKRSAHVKHGKCHDAARRVAAPTVTPRCAVLRGRAKRRAHATAGRRRLPGSGRACAGPTNDSIGGARRGNAHVSPDFTGVPVTMTRESASWGKAVHPSRSAHVGQEHVAIGTVALTWRSTVDGRRRRAWCVVSPARPGSLHGRQSDGPQGGRCHTRGRTTLVPSAQPRCSCPRVTVGGFAELKIGAARDSTRTSVSSATYPFRAGGADGSRCAIGRLPP